MKHLTTRLLPLLPLFALSACSEDSSAGEIRLRASGEAAATQGYPVEVDGETIGPVDGFTITFEHVYVGLASFDVARRDEAPAELALSSMVFDLAAGDPALGTFSLPAGRYVSAGYTTRVPSSTDVRLGDVTEAAVETMRAAGHAIHVLGVARHGDTSFRFDFGFPPVRQTNCVGADGTPGFVVRDAGVHDVELTFHLDHLFFDDLASDEPNLRFEPLAAAAEDGTVTLDDLTALITEIRDRNGDPITEDGETLVYDPGAFATDPPTLRNFLLAAGRTMGHFQGEGHCDYEVLAD